MRLIRTAIIFFDENTTSMKYSRYMIHIKKGEMRLYDS